MSTQEVVLVTGANTGFGFQIIRALCNSEISYRILLGGRSLTKIHDAINAATKEFPETQSKLSPLQVDIEDDDSIQKAFIDVQSEFGLVDVLINNAGMQISWPVSTHSTLPTKA